MQAIDQWTLSNGTALTLRSVRPSDADALGALIMGLSPGDRRLRFHGGVARVSQPWARRLAEAQPPKEFAVVAFAHLPLADHLIADARWSIDETGVGAEMALMVAAAWRRVGIGERALMALLQAARDAGLCRVHGSVLAQNTAMLALLERCGFRCAADECDQHLVSAEVYLDRARRPRGGPHRPTSRWWESTTLRRLRAAFRMSQSTEVSSHAQH